MNTVTPFKLHSSEQLNEAKMLSDLELVERIVGGDLALYELIMRRYNQRLFRIARSILQDDGEAEDMVQDTWIKAYEKLATFRGPQGFASWLSRIATNMAIMRSRRADWSQPHLTVGNSNPEEPMQLPTSKKYTPEGAAWNGL